MLLPISNYKRECWMFFSVWVLNAVKFYEEQFYLYNITKKFSC